MSIDRLSAIETAYLDVEHPGCPMHTGAVAIFEGGPLLDRRGQPRRRALVRALEQRIHLIPKFRKVVAPPPFGIGRPVWIDDPRFSIAHHVHVIGVPAPGGDAELFALAELLHSELLDRTRPLWEMWLVTGLEGGRVAIVQKTHHALADGVSGVDAATVLLDVDRKPPRIDPPAWSPARGPGVASLATDTAWRAMQVPRTGVRAVRRAAQLLRHPSGVSDAVGSLVGAGHGGPFAPHSSLNQPVGALRQLSVVRTELEPVRAAAHHYGVKVNDVALQVVTAGLRRVLVARGEHAGEPLRALVPVSLRGADEHGSLGNRVAALIVPLPVDEPDPVAQLRLIGAATAEAKRRGESRVSEGLLSVADHLPRLAVGAVAHAIDHQPLLNLVVTNVPGPAVPLYALGAEMIEAIPMVPLAGNLTVGVAILSYNGQLTFGIRADPSTCPDADVLAAGMQDAIDDLLRRAAPSRTPALAARASGT